MGKERKDRGMGGREGKRKERKGKNQDRIQIESLQQVGLLPSVGHAYTQCTHTHLHTQT